MNHTKPIFTWVNCYGAWDPKLRSAIDTAGYDAYLSNVARTLTDIRDQIRVVYLSGGMLDELGRSECATTLPELKRRLGDAAKGLEFHEDTVTLTSITSAHSFLDIWRTHYLGFRPIFFSDSARAATNAFTLEYFAAQSGYTLPPTSELIISFPRADSHPNSSVAKQDEKLSLLKDRGVEIIEAQETKERRAVNELRRRAAAR